MSTRTFRLPVVTTTVPSWFVAMDDRTWASIPGGTDVIEDEAGYRPGGIMSYSSGCACPSRQSLMLHGGGHGAGGDNGVYEFPILDTTGSVTVKGTTYPGPKWRLYKARSAYRGYPSWVPPLNWDLQEVKWNPDHFWERYSVGDDWAAGEPSASHTYNSIVWAEDTNRLFLCAQGGLWSYPTNTPTNWGTATPNRYGVWCLDDATRTWTALNRDTGYGTLGQSNFTGDQSAVWTNEHPTLGPHILRLKAGSTTDSWPWTTNTTTGERTRLTTWAGGARIAAAYRTQCPLAVATGLGFMVGVDISAQRLLVINATDYSDARNNDFRTTIAAGSGLAWPTGQWSQNHGMVWHGPSGGFLLWGAANEATPNLWKLAPTTQCTTLEQWLSATWAFTSISPALTNAIVPTAPAVAAQAQTYKRFNIIRDVAGSGRDALVLINSVAGPTFIYKLPAGGLT